MALQGNKRGKGGKGGIRFQGYFNNSGKYGHLLNEMMPIARKFIKRSQKERKEERRECEAAKVVTRTKTRGGVPLEDSKCDVASARVFHPLVRVGPARTSRPQRHESVDECVHDDWIHESEKVSWTIELQTVAHQDCMCLEVKRRPSEGSRRGQLYTAVRGKKIGNEGEKDITMVIVSKGVWQTKWQTLDITRPLSSV